MTCLKASSPSCGFCSSPNGKEHPGACWLANDSVKDLCHNENRLWYTRGCPSNFGWFALLGLGLCSEIVDSCEVASRDSELGFRVVYCMSYYTVDQESVDTGLEAGEVLWNRGLLKRVGICHGISENIYVFLSLYRLTGKPEYFALAKAFASFLLDKSERLIAEGKMHGGDRPFSLFEGIGGMSYLFFDMINPTQALFPSYEVYNV